MTSMHKKDTANSPESKPPSKVRKRPISLRIMRTPSDDGSEEMPHFDEELLMARYSSLEHLFHTVVCHAVICTEQNKPDAAITDMDMAISYVQKNIKRDMSAFLAYLHIHRGAIHHKYGNYQAAVSDFSEAMAFAKLLHSANTKDIRAILLWHALSNRSTAYAALGHTFSHYVDMAKAIGMALFRINMERAEHQDYWQGLPSQIAPTLWPKLPLIM